MLIPLQSEPWMMTKRRRVALLIESSRAFGRDLLRGIATYARAHEHWAFFHQERAVRDPAPARLADWRADGIIARIETTKHIEQIRRLGVPVVDVFGLHRLDGIPSVEVDQEAVVRLAIEHLRERNLPHFAFCGYPGLFFSDARSRLFVRLLAEAGHDVHVYETTRQRPNTGLSRVEMRSLRCAAHLAAWVKSLPKPTGLMACNDMRALQVLEACAEQRIAVPDEVAVIGVDNDAVQCELCDPPLSSVDPAARQVGYEAAALLDRMLSGRKPVTNPILIKPSVVVARQSTAVLAVSDPHVADAVRFMHARCCEPIRTADVARHAGVSRSTLERRFTRSLGRSPSAELARMRLERVRELLQHTDLSLRAIADRAGFDHVESMCRLFKKHAGQTPGAYRRQAPPPDDGRGGGASNP
ncbi:MAG TPA: XylR family transcriptional regulator [Planctomycetaceae bacterium]|nr:XylR family transcriptional regulator [Planctomycetaceae bacterium]